MDLKRCPVCESSDEAAFSLWQSTASDCVGVDCEKCGRYEISESAVEDKLLRSSRNVTPRWRAFVSHRLRTTEGRVVLTTSAIAALPSTPLLPSPGQQATNLIRIIGDFRTTNELDFYLHLEAVARMGAENQSRAYQVCRELIANGLIAERGSVKWVRPNNLTISGTGFDLTLKGWDRYEEAKHGRAAGTQGFLALRFGDPKLDEFVNTVLKPGLAAEIGYKVVDMRDVGRAGLIDNIMRAQIADSAFVIADLTHDNSGAYWEAGFAEGMRKPVIYICERTKFAKAKSHFDTNHSTTVLWSTDEPAEFVRELAATVRRSLGLFERAPPSSLPA